MKFLLWEIKWNPRRLARLQWVLFKLFNIKCKTCGWIKSNCGPCYQPFETKYCDVINENKNHRVVCKCCGTTRMQSSNYIDPTKDASEWFEF